MHKDTELITFWTQEFVSALRSFEPPFLGAVGPSCPRSGVAQAAHHFVHRRHMDSFGDLYPPELTLAQVGAWMTSVYGINRTSRLHRVRACRPRITSTQPRDSKYNIVVPKTEGSRSNDGAAVSNSILRKPKSRSNAEPSLPTREGPPGCEPRLPPSFASASENIVALASFPGSGSTWMRELLELSTGILTGSSMPETPQLRRRFRGSGRADGSVVAVKTHCAGGRDRLDPLCKNSQYNRWYHRAVVLVRDPQEVLREEFNRQTKSHDVGRAAVGLESPSSAWRRFVKDGARRWEAFHEDIKERYAAKDLHVVLYDELVAAPERELDRVLRFLGREPAGLLAEAGLATEADRSLLLRCAVLSSELGEAAAHPMADEQGSSAAGVAAHGSPPAPELLVDTEVRDELRALRDRVYGLQGVTAPTATADNIGDAEAAVTCVLP
eukprot:CAMPEP_0113718186 /NCGR_PEP_ID=MMETSP0038_2-20120614/35034_1 /TAXON_ID=2898 /ORGANISM="Cryptomonas paramecium" /LENGTH=439 /DNA_ID=CAMNT_0000646249 /DNA_START=532 /DNA_END=1848 /DNA_ORIENTATION=- /assembly_acc=CAM_ASM_000170